MHYTFRKASENEVTVIFDMIAARVRWMDGQGIHQWNDTDYLHVYPLAYYVSHLADLYVLEDADRGAIVCAGALYSEDARWAGRDSSPAFYVHHLVSVPGFRGVGEIFLREAEAYAKRLGKQYMRLDSAVGNAGLTQFYERQGYLPCGECVDGEYFGILREKRIG